MSLSDLSNALGSLQYDPTFNMGLGLMAASGPSLMPHSFGQDMAKGIQASQQARQAALQAQILQYQAQQAGLNNQMLQYATRMQQGGGSTGYGDFATPDQARAATANLGAPSSNAGNAPALASANGTPGTSYADPQAQQQSIQQPSYDPMTSYLRTPLGAMQFAFDKPGFFGHVAPAPTDFVKDVQAMGVDPSSDYGRHLIAANVAKQNYIAPTSLRGGGYMFDPQTGGLTNLPTSSPGFQVIRDPVTGQFQEVPVAGGVQAISASEAAKAGAQAGAKAAVTPYSYQGPDGRTVNTTQGNYAAAVGGQGAPQDPNQVASSLAAQATQMVKDGLPEDAVQAWLQRKMQEANVGYQPASGGAAQGAIIGPSPGYVAGQESASKAAQGAPSKQMAESYGSLSNADSAYQQSRQALQDMLDLANNKGVSGTAVGLLPGSVSTRISSDAAKYEKAHATYVALQGKALGSSGTDAARETIDEAVPTYDKPQSAMVAGLNMQLNNLDLAHLKTQFLNPIYQQGNEKSYTQLSAAFDRNVTPDMAPVLQLSGETQKQAVAAAIKRDPALKSRFEWAYNHGMLQ